MPADLCARCGTALKNQFRLPLPCPDSMVLEERNRHKRDLLDSNDGTWVDSQVLNKRPVHQIVFRLKTEDPQRNIREGISVYGVYFRFKTFKSIQALPNLSGSKPNPHRRVGAYIG